MSTTSAFAGVKVQPRVNVRSQRAQTVIMANASGPKRVSVHRRERRAIFHAGRAPEARATRAARAEPRRRGAIADRARRESISARSAASRPRREAARAADRGSSDEVRATMPSRNIASVSRKLKLTLHAFSDASRLTGHQGQGWPGWRWLQGLHRGWLRPQDVRLTPLLSRRRVRSRERTRARRRWVPRWFSCAPAGEATRRTRATAGHERRGVPRAATDRRRSRTSRRARVLHSRRSRAVPPPMSGVTSVVVVPRGGAKGRARGRASRSRTRVRNSEFFSAPAAEPRPSPDADRSNASLRTRTLC